MKISRSAATMSLTVLASLFLAGSLASCDAQTGTKIAEAVSAAPSAAGTSSSNAAEAATALAQLETIPVKGRATKTGYTREQFGAAWSDVDHKRLRHPQRHPRL